jgi:diguanylate cyclase (GGDEF)-like protein
MMTLDLPTLMTMESLVAACAGSVLLIAWFQCREVCALALWGIASIIAAAGVFSLMLGATLHEQDWSIIGGALLVLAPGLMWKAARTLDAKPASLAVSLSGIIFVVGLVSVFPRLGAIRGSLNLAVGATYLFATAATLWLGRRERLPARWPLIVLTSLHAVVLSIGAGSVLTGSTAPDEAPQAASLFGFVHFESIIFSLGVTMFILALLKDRKLAAARMAAEIDPLTGIANRAAFMRSAEHIIDRCRRDAVPVCAMMFDLDQFKRINDTHGHAIGDAVIRRFCEVTTAALRPNEVIGRIGGEEFAVVLPGSSIEAASVRAEKIRAAFANSCRLIGDLSVNATVSGGVSTATSGEYGLSTLLGNSDAALYRAKADGRNCIRRANKPTQELKSSNVLRVA